MFGGQSMYTNNFSFCLVHLDVKYGEHFWDGNEGHIEILEDKLLISEIAELKELKKDFDNSLDKRKWKPKKAWSRDHGRKLDNNNDRWSKRFDGFIIPMVKLDNLKIEG